MVQYNFSDFAQSFKFFMLKRYCWAVCLFVFLFFFFFIYFVNCYFFIPLTVCNDQLIQGVEMPSFSSSMCFVSPQVMYYCNFKLRRLVKWYSICNLYFAECKAFTRHDNPIWYGRFKGNACRKKSDYKRIVLLSNDITRIGDII